jgi:hypothetical protein
MFLKHNYWYSVLFFLILNLSRNLNLNLNLFCCWLLDAGCWLLVAGSLGSAACLARIRQLVNWSIGQLVH